MTVQEVSISGFRSIRDANVELRNLNVLVGANGSGKSNFLDALTLTGQHVLHGLPKQFCKDDNLHPEAAHLEIAVNFDDGENQTRGRFEPKPGGYLETVELTRASFETENRMATWMKYDLSHLGHLEFMQQSNHSRLRRDGLNLPYRIEYIKAERPKAFEFISQTAQQYASVSPNLEKDDFWRLSPGTLCLMAMTDILHEPGSPPALLMIENPDANLSPLALNAVTEMIKSYAADHQVIITTSSPNLVNLLRPEDLIICDVRRDDLLNTTYRRISGAQLENLENTWLKDYSLGELWLQNEFGGRP